MNKTNKGISYIQYAILVLILIAVLVPIFFVMGKTIVQSFNDFKNLLAGGQTAQEQTARGHFGWNYNNGRCRVSWGNAFCSCERVHWW